MSRKRNRQKSHADGGSTDTNLTKLGLGRADGGSTKTSSFGNPNVLKEAKRSDNIGVIGDKTVKPNMSDAHGGSIKAKKRASGGEVSADNTSEYGNPNVLKEGKRGAAFNAYSSSGGPSKNKINRKTGGTCK
jgi:hypothetical protein